MVSDGSESPCGFPVPLTYSWPRDEPAQQTPKAQARQAEPWQGHQLPPHHPALCPACCWQLQLGFTGLVLSNPDTALPVPPHCPACPHRLASPRQPGKGGNVLVLGLGRGRCAELWLLSPPRSSTDWGNTSLITDHQVMIYFIGHRL